MTSQLAKYDIKDTVWIRIGPLPLLAVFFGLIVLITVNSAWYINQDATPGWITAAMVINIVLALGFMGIMLYIFQSAGAYVASKTNNYRFSPLSIGMSGLNTTRVMLLAIGLFSLFVTSTLFAVQKESLENANDQTSYFAAIIASIIVSIGGFLLLIASYNELLSTLS